jgi:hypothetical protein
VNHMKIVPASPAVDLTADEVALIKHFRTMDQRARLYTFRLAERQAEQWPQTPVPRLSLVSGGAK